VRIIAFELAHGEALLEDELNDERNRPAPEFGNFMPTMVHEDMAFTGIDNGYLVAAAGILPIWKGVGEAWLLGANRLGKHKIRVAKEVRKGLHRIADEQGMWRIQAAMRSDWPELARWARFLGMKHEGTMKKFGANGLDYERWAWVDGI
jgi:hypothetical protein